MEICRVTCGALLVVQGKYSFEVALLLPTLVINTSYGVLGLCWTLQCSVQNIRALLDSAVLSCVFCQECPDHRMLSWPPSPRVLCRKRLALQSTCTLALASVSGFGFYTKWAARSILNITLPFDVANASTRFPMLSLGILGFRTILQSNSIN